MKTPILSICIPTYNRPNLLKENLLSIIFSGLSPENYELLEIVITDNSDNSETVEVIDEIKKIFSNVKYFKNQTNIGAPRNLLKSLDCASGNYLWLMGDDDLVVFSKIDHVIDKLKKNVYGGVIVNFAQGYGKNPKIITMDNCLNLKNDKVFVGKNDLFANEDFINFFALNFMSVLIFKKEYFDKIKNEVDKFDKSCYIQSYAFLFIAALDRNILRLNDTCVIWRSPTTNRRYDTWQKNEEDIFFQYIEYINFAGQIGFVYNKKYLLESIRLKEFNFFYFKKNIWKKQIKDFLVRHKLDTIFNKFLYFIRYLKYLIKL